MIDRDDRVKQIALRIGNAHAFPVFHACRANDDGSESAGMTYFQWLVGQALQGLSANPESWMCSYLKVTEMAIESASVTVLRMAQAEAERMDQPA